MIKIKDLCKSFDTPAGKLEVLKNLDLELEDGTFVAILGKSGSGKSTLLAMLGALDKPNSGSIEIDGQEISKMGDGALIKIRREQIGFIFQGYNLIPNLTSLQNVVLAFEINHIPNKKRVELAERLLKLVGIDEPKWTRRATKLSGGEQQRVTIARALANGPKLLLADEPTGNLDQKTSETIIKLLKDLSRMQKTTVICVTHDKDVTRVADEAYELENMKLIKIK